MKKIKFRFWFLMVLLVFAPVLAQDKDIKISSPNASSGSTNLFTVSGSGAGTPNGDYVSANTALNQPYRFFIEVPPGLNRLVVEIFDADVGLGGASEAAAGRDRDRSGFNSSVNYSIRNPSGVLQTTLTGNVSSPAGSDNAWVALYDSTASLTPGHWEVRVDMSSAVTTGDDINAFGIRAHDGLNGSGGTELNVYSTIMPLGINPPASGTLTRGYNLYPYITSDCLCAKNDFDFDSNSGNVGSMVFTSRTGTFTQNFASAALSANDVWVRNNFAGWTTDRNAGDYGIWSSTLNISSYIAGGQSGNYGNVYLSNSQAAANPPSTNSPANTFRFYLPTDGGTAPLKPYLSQSVSQLAGTNPIPAGQTGTIRVKVEFVNPTTQPVTFSASNLVTANIPGGGAVFAGGAGVSQGTIPTRPAIGGTGNIAWNPGVVAPGATAILLYNVNVTPASAGQRIPVTATPASGNGTRAVYVDETGNTTQAVATFTFGPLCELAVTEGVINPTPTAASVPVSGRVMTGDGYSVRSALVEVTNSAGETQTAMTNPFGYFRFAGLPAGETYIFNVRHKRYAFVPQPITVTEEITDLNLTVQ